MQLPRSSGVQLHPTSLPSGTFGRDAFEFVDWLQQAGQSWWQLLPLTPPDRHRSPYKSASAFAGWSGLLAAPRARVTKSQQLDFVERNRFWIEDWKRFAGRDAVADQVRFEREWGTLRDYAAQRGVGIVGDVPIYVAPGGADHRAHPALFLDGVVAGAPPDDFSATGQLWGNPVYDWPAVRREGYRWWIERMRRTFDLYDVARIDHFRGFVAYWAVPAESRSAVDGRWRRGPGRAVFDAIVAELGELPLIAEDLGRITPAVRRLRDELALPGMVVMQFAFDPRDPESPHELQRHRTNSVAYTGTHDHDTARGWFQSAPEEVRRAMRAALLAVDPGAGALEPWWGLIRLTQSSRARLAVVQAQDVLGLGSEARMNVPGRTSAWRWRLRRGALTPDLARRLHEETARASRLPR